MAHRSAELGRLDGHARLGQSIEIDGAATIEPPQAGSCDRAVRLHAPVRVREQHVAVGIDEIGRPEGDCVGLRGRTAHPAKTIQSLSRSNADMTG